MYTSFYNLKQKPFEITSDPSFLWQGEKHREALATLRYGILNNKGFLLLTGDVGTGKTTLINALIKSLSEDVIHAYVTDPNLDPVDFYTYIAHSFGIKNGFKTKGNFLIIFKKFLLKAFEAKKRVLLIIDESQLLTDELLEQIRLLSNIDRVETKLLNIFFVGQPEFNNVLMKDKNRAVRQRIALNYNLEALDKKETEKYIHHRLSVAGTSDKIFKQDAVNIIHIYSRGFPRRINVICDHCLLSGYVKEKYFIDKKIARECSKELNLPFELVKKNSGKMSFGRDNKKPALSLIMVLFLISISGFFMILNKEQIQERIKDFLYKDHTIEKPLETLTEKLPEKLLNEKKESAGLKKINETEAPHPDNINTDESTIVQHKDIIEKNISSTIDKNNKMPRETSEAKAPHKVIIPPFKEKTVVLRFKYNTNEFDESALKKIDESAEILNLYPHSKIFITGYTDSLGSSKYNTKLSEFRANMVKSFLIGKGIAPSRIDSIGMGPKNPVGKNSTAWGRKMNRRVEIKIYQKDQLSVDNT